MNTLSGSVGQPLSLSLSASSMYAHYIPTGHPMGIFIRVFFENVVSRMFRGLLFQDLFEVIFKRNSWGVDKGHHYKMKPPEVFFESRDFWVTHTRVLPVEPDIPLGMMCISFAKIRGQARLQPVLSSEDGRHVCHCQFTSSWAIDSKKDREKWKANEA